MKDTQPLVSVIAACYNHSRFVLECLESIRNQTYKNTQLIILDDCSMDDSVAMIRAWIAEHAVECIFVAHSENEGICRTLNEALTYTTGKYVSIISTDDVWAADKLECQVEQMEQLPEDVGVLYGDAMQIDESGNLLPATYMDSDPSFSTPPEGHVLPMLFVSNFVPAVATLIRKSCYDKVGVYDEKLSFEDLDMWLRIAECYKFAFSPHISSKYRIVATSMVRTVSRTTKWLTSKFVIYSRYVGFDNTDCFHKRALKDHLDATAEMIYEIGYEKRNFYLWKTLRYDPRLRTLGMFIFSACGATYNTFSDFDAWFARLRQRFRSFAVK